jgi:transposase
MWMETEQDPPESDGSARRRRRSWSDEEKRQIVRETRQPGASVSAVARRHDVNANLVFTWRRQFGDEDLGNNDTCAFVPVVVPTGAPSGDRRVSREEAPEPPGGVAATPLEVTGRIEIVLAGGRRVIVDKAVNAPALARVIGVLERR